ncbi:MAG: helix-turn-helix domain-containing protein [Kofleriaceae bacterium]|nr:helix-turn-helix domain-containing protein [Kofleriaceae bacterium]MBP6841911.1 helix-turn-helix domain-containing protein [Kofleriaceae bacterium]MBP9206121.1 helix-turn-helix domain-containing protein [Kofleriaceae bacterium]
MSARWPATPRVVALASGKGGTGKSLIAANVGVYLATLGKRVIVVDASFGAPNLHLFVGVPRPGRTLSEYTGDAGPVRLADLAVATPTTGLRLIAATADPATAADPDPAWVAALAGELRGLPADWVIVDLAAGTHRATLDLLLAADLPVLCATADPTAIELMHRLVRAAFLTRLDRAGLGDLAGLAAEEARSEEGGMISALDLYLRTTAAADPRLDELRLVIAGFAPLLAVNQVRSKSDMEMGRAVASVAHRRLGVPISYLGHLEYDEAVWASTRRRRPLLVEHPETRVAKCFERVARGLLAARPPDLGAGVIPSDNHYDLLEVAPTASFEDIRRANRRIRDVYGTESVAIAGLYDPPSLEAVHRRLDLAYTTLMDAAKRKEYDSELFPDGVPLPPVAIDSGPIVRPERRDDSQVGVVRPPMPQLGPRTEYTGALLRQVREAHGVELREVAERSKIGMGYLLAIEEERFSKLPATVYVRGFLGEIARLLGLPAERVKESYLERIRAVRGATEPPDDGGKRKG